jgi:hypothetical protein
VPLLTACTRDGDRALLEHPKYLEALGYPAGGSARAGDVWRHLVSQLESEPGFGEWKPALDVILNEGCLARRIVTALGPAPSRPRLEAVYRGLASCLDAGEMFRDRA